MVTGSELSQTLMVQLPSSQSESKKPRVGQLRETQRCSSCVESFYTYIYMSHSHTPHTLLRIYSPPPHMYSLTHTHLTHTHAHPHTYTYLVHTLTHTCTLSLSHTHPHPLSYLPSLTHPLPPSHTLPPTPSPPHAGRPRTKPPKEHKEWHYHLGGMRHSRVPLTPELKEVLEVAYVSRIMSKNFRKEGQPEKERIARITGMDLDKVRCVL